MRADRSGVDTIESELVARSSSKTRVSASTILVGVGDIDAGCGRAHCDDTRRIGAGHPDVVKRLVGARGGIKLDAGIRDPVTASHQLQCDEHHDMGVAGAVLHVGLGCLQRALQLSRVATGNDRIALNCGGQASIGARFCHGGRRNKNCSEPGDTGQQHQSPHQVSLSFRMARRDPTGQTGWRNPFATVGSRRLYDVKQRFCRAAADDSDRNARLDRGSIAGFRWTVMARLRDGRS